ncbi:MAG: MTAP family purine nucleoside phosphorylase [Ardenticatenaceae bacterium]|nr:MTAP family purine nucleoside phosphorylase [Ardenticatenaceae bacterium]HBY99412.1 S-methyl-5'-thioadenosine phosphorylase [Chloroflexota bacterium]
MPVERVGLIATYNMTDFLEGVTEERVSTPWGEAHYSLGELDSQPVVLLQRYGRGMEMIQHLINFRANIWGFRELGVQRVIATDGVGSLRRDLEPGTFVVVDDFLDFTSKGRLSFFEEHGCSVRIDVSTPFCPTLRAAFIKGTRQVTSAVREEGVLVGSDGPRFETRAEGRMFRQLGADIVGTLLIPEIVLAREAEICLALLCIVINYGPGLEATIDRRGPGSMEEKYYEGPHRQLPAILRETFAHIPPERECICTRAVPQTAFGHLPTWYRKES